MAFPKMNVEKKFKKTFGISNKLKHKTLVQIRKSNNKKKDTAKCETRTHTHKEKILEK